MVEIAAEIIKENNILHKNYTSRLKKPRGIIIIYIKWFIVYYAPANSELSV